ncbi:MAG: arginyltransferase [Cycloclasticus sp.]|nr:MAG: arginyltransferase [Cycloclasticus sp.]
MLNKPQRSLSLYISSPQACDYLDNNIAQNIFISPEEKIDSVTYEYLLSVGFRRSGEFIYRPHCKACQACISCRVPLSSFSLSRSQKRVLNKNKDLERKTVNAEFNDEHYALYLKYQRSRHAGGVMENFDEKAYKDFLCQSPGESVFIESWLNGQLVAVALTDVFQRSMSAVYTFFDPDHPTRSLGTLSVLEQIQCAQSLNKDYLYLGYYIQASKKMTYKANFQPLQLFENDNWVSYKDSLSEK